MSEHRTVPAVEAAGSGGREPQAELSGSVDGGMRSMLEGLHHAFPPADAAMADGRVRFRLVRSDPPTAADFVPHCMEPGFDRRRFVNQEDTAAVSGYTGLSVLNTHARALKLQRGIPGLRSRLVATGPIAGGVTRRASTGHLVWWPQATLMWFWEADREALAGTFRVVDEDPTTDSPLGRMRSGPQEPSDR